MHARSLWRSAPAGASQVVTRLKMGVRFSNLGSWTLGSAPFMASGFDGVWGRASVLEGRLQIFTEYARGLAFPFAKNTGFWDTLNFLHLRDFVVLVLHYFAAMLLYAPFLRESSKHSKAQILHSMKTAPKPKLKRTRSVACNGMRTSTVSLLCNCKLDALALWQRDPRLL